jgi:hypothetical protein
MTRNNQKAIKSKRDRTTENFGKRIATMIGKCDDLRQYQADVFLFVRRNGKSYTYNSCSGRWVPTEEEIVSTTRTESLIGLTAVKDKFYPPPIRKSPADCLCKQKKSSDANINSGNKSLHSNFAPAEELLRTDKAINENKA